VIAKLRALWDTKKIHKGGFYHDGRFATLPDVVNHYDDHFHTSLSEREKLQCRNRLVKFCALPHDVADLAESAGALICATVDVT